MKKLLATIALLTCLLGLTACGSDSMSDTEKTTYQGVANNCYSLMVSYGGADASTATLSEMFLSNVSLRDWNTEAEALSEYIYIEGSVLKNGVESWWTAMETLETASLKETDSSKWEVEETNGTITVKVPIQGSEYTAIMEVTLDEEYNVTGIVTNINYSFGEKMTKAALNTLLGMGTVFIVLIFMCFVIYGFGLIPKVQNAMAKKKASGAEVKKEAVDNTIAQIAEREEDELSDDLELVAVISAAIAASEGAASTDGFVVRSIKRANRR